MDNEAPDCHPRMARPSTLYLTRPDSTDDNDRSRSVDCCRLPCVGLPNQILLFSPRFLDSPWGSLTNRRLSLAGSTRGGSRGGMERLNLPDIEFSRACCTKKVSCRCMLTGQSHIVLNKRLLRGLR